MHDAQRALIWTMVLVSASDGDMTDAELRTIGDSVQRLQAFRGFDPDLLTDTARACTDVVSGPDGLDAALGRIRRDLPEHLRETAYAMACEIARADPRTSREEVRVLQLIRDALGIDPLIAAAIDRGARARHTPL
jgi:tellurite resistance protein